MHGAGPARLDHRPRLRRPAPRHRVRRGGRGGRPASTPPGPRRAAARAFVAHRRHHRRAPRRRPRRPPSRRRPGGARPTPTPCSCASRPPITATKDPDLGPVLSAAALIRDHLRAGPAHRPPVHDLPGHDDRAVPRGRRGSPGSRPGTDFDLAFAPERVNPGDPASACAACRASSAARRRRPRSGRPRCCATSTTRVVELSSPDAAEMAKLLENTFRNVNIAFVNQLALLCERMGLDVWEVIDAAATKPFGFMQLHPGARRRRPLHPGGPVLPRLAGPRVRLHRALHRARPATSTSAMPRHVVDLVGRGAQRARPGAQGRPGRRPRRRVQAGRPGRPQLAGRRRHRRDRRARRGRCATTTRTCRPTATRPAGRTRASASTRCSTGPT